MVFFGVGENPFVEAIAVPAPTSRSYKCYLQVRLTCTPLNPFLEAGHALTYPRNAIFRGG